MTAPGSPIEPYDRMGFEPELDPHLDFKCTFKEYQSQVQLDQKGLVLTETENIHLIM